MEANTGVNNACLHKRGAELGAVERGGGWGLVGARLCVLASDGSPRETETQKKSLVVVAQFRLNFPRNKTPETVALVGFQHHRCQNSPAALRNGDRVCFGHLGHLTWLQSKKASDSIIQLGETVPRLEGDDTCRGSAWWRGSTRSGEDRAVRHQPAWGFISTHKNFNYSVKAFAKHGSVFLMKITFLTFSPSENQA